MMKSTTKILIGAALVGFLLSSPKGRNWVGRFIRFAGDRLLHATRKSRLLYTSDSSSRRAEFYEAHEKPVLKQLSPLWGI